MADKAPVQSSDDTQRSESQIPRDRQASQKFFGIFRPIDDFFDSVRSVALKHTPAIFINHASQVHQAIGMSENIANIWYSNQRGLNALSTSSVLGLGTNILGSSIKEKPLTDAEYEREHAMSVPQYLATRTAQMLDPVHHIRQTIGGGYIVSGMLYGISGFMQKKAKLSAATTTAMQGAFTAAAGTTLAYTLDPQDAWQWGATIFALRQPVGWTNSLRQCQDTLTHPYHMRTHAPVHPITPYVPLMRSGAQLGSTVYGFLYGGAHKNPDGSIVITDPKRRGKAEKEAMPETPTTQVSGAVSEKKAQAQAMTV